ncbi:molybdopterin-guanine dinucleotide biosynthesis protein B [Verminephrobacter aporrectodeae]|uniref:Molybdopterin-guanine dinucleotide biosynthesis protein B n=2 Tax=Verminephrobacter TaxID=364316 RepID=A0ABT3KVJ7_9BURK|nr:molybdopterin-guanine dinucleotide biosynthesis protein B [Verminephrobacter aporrectodeae]MCW5223292.1 molybdopterin-guanine dinucleotide biosynthesis protein B [Verminephrobacter aporrectodeae subsp. tuberculatae]MCW5256496.1 molybdopterin-guanine dinucleotide biosynthesis protein B [Verminephrobacter aporrectodeae subsp. tuberculatae]MCW5288756.1 molybdopterin-guanine dinucleotide biosynthesis protein B [Verminephrobacter aporrectodeae subsp. tuberculatae]MCW5322343.1 molybdopterin-guanin
MKVVGFAGFSGSGKTTLIEQLIPALRLRGLRVSVVKHAHHSFDIDHPGKDTYRHRAAGAFEVVAASDQRLVLMREFGQATALSVHHLLAELCPSVDWVLVEGFKDSDLRKIEVWRAPEPGQLAKPVRYPGDDRVLAVVTDAPQRLPEPTRLPVLDLNAPARVAHWLLEHAQRFEYASGLHAGLLPCAPR